MSRISGQSALMGAELAKCPIIPHLHSAHMHSEMDWSITTPMHVLRAMMILYIV